MSRSERSGKRIKRPIFPVRGVGLGGRGPELVDEASEFLVAVRYGRALRLRDVGSPREEWAKAELIQPSVQYPLGTGALSAPLRHETEDLLTDLTQD